MTEEALAVPATYSFDEPFQQKIAALALRDADFAARADGLLNPDYLANHVDATLVSLGIEHYRKYHALPSVPALVTIIKEAIANKRIRPEIAAEIKPALSRLLRTDLTDKGFVIDKIAEFARHQALEQALIKSVEHLTKRDFAAIEAEIKKAAQVGAVDTRPVYDYFKEIESRTQKRLEIAAGTYAFRGISTGYPELDKYLYHRGWGRRELSLLMGAAKASKSIGLWDFGKNASLMGHNVLGFTCEMAAEIIGDRIDANISDTMMKALGDHPHDVAGKIRAAEAKAGRFDIYAYPIGTLKPAEIRRVLENYRARGIVIDLVVIDYLDIMGPNHRTDSNIENSRSIYVDVRAIAQEYDVAILSATQTNRDGAKATTAKMTDVAEDFNRIRIADVVISINAGDDEKGNGEARLYWAASRNTEDGFTVFIKQDRARMKFIKRIEGDDRRTSAPVAGAPAPTAAAA